MVVSFQDGGVYGSPARAFPAQVRSSTMPAVIISGVSWLLYMLAGKELMSASAVAVARVTHAVISACVGT
jgi:hypothetical protein